jgi:branched-chain amino acid transport system substrate-binding protein
MHGWRRASCLIAAAIIASAAVVGCGSSNSSGGSSSGSGSSSSSGNSAQGKKDPVKILAILDMTGPTKFLGTADKAGLDAAVNYLNKNGGMDGRKVELNVVSDNGDPTTSVTTFLKQIQSNGKPTFCFCGSYSSISAALQPVASRNKVLTWAFGDGNFACQHDASSKCGPFFSINSPPATYVQQQVDYMQQKGYKKIGIIADQRDTSVTESTIQKQMFPKAGLQPTFVQTPAKTVNVLPQMSKLKAAGVDAVFAEQIGPATGYVLQARKKLGWKVPVIFDISGSSSAITTLAPKSLWSDDASMQIFSVIDPTKDYPGAKLMVANDPGAKGAGGFGGQPGNVAAFGWDAIMLLNAAVSGTHSLDAVTNQKWLETNAVTLTDTKGLQSSHKFTADDHENSGWSPDDYAIVPVAPVGEDGFLQQSGS